ncbi:MAG TPA: PEP-CTERM sorting domain-containing protein [Caldimonas sp.]|nr:PEP-CTERM sorting domain-containing protein [Caldimonas sp.]
MTSASSGVGVRSLAASRARLIVTGALTVIALAAQAAPFELVYTGTFNTTESLNLASAGSRTFFSASTPFTITAFFDNSSPNVLPPAPVFSGFHAYVPTLATIQINGATYKIDTAATNSTAGVTVAIFDRSSSFNTGRYGIGLIANVVSDGAGIVGDFAGASPEFSVNALTPVTYTDYFGVGHGSGPCISGNPPACPHLDTPWVLHDSSNVAWNLTLGNYIEDYPSLHPGSGATTVGALNTAAILAVPEPATIGLLLAGLAGVGARTRAQRRNA